MLDKPELKGLNEEMLNGIAGGEPPNWSSYEQLDHIQI